jgi:hypothetical protein
MIDEEVRTVRLLNDRKTTPIPAPAGYEIEATIQRRGLHFEAFQRMGGQQFRTPQSVLVRGYGAEHRLSIPQAPNMFIPAAIPVAAYVLARIAVRRRRSS